MSRRYELIESDSIMAPSGAKLYRIRALQSFSFVTAGDVGGYIEHERNLSQEPCTAWVSGSARVFGFASVSGNARVVGDASVFGDAQVSGSAKVSDAALVFGFARVSDSASVVGSARVFGFASVSGNARVVGNARVSGAARVSGNARVSDSALVFGDASVSGAARVSGNARVSDSALVFGFARVSDSASVSGSARVFGDAIVRGTLLTCSRSDSYTFAVVATPAGPRIMAGCRYFSFDEAIAHWTKTRGGTKLGDESLAIVAHLRTMATINGLDAPVTEETAA